MHYVVPQAAITNIINTINSKRASVPELAKDGNMNLTKFAKMNKPISIVFVLKKVSLKQNKSHYRSLDLHIVYVNEVLPE